MSKFTFKVTAPITETELQNNEHETILGMIAEYIVSAPDLETMKRRQIVVRRRLTAQAYTAAFDMLVEQTNEVFDNEKSA